MTHYESDLKPRLEQLAYRRSKPFCYGCYIEVPTGQCTTCHSDDLMRLVPGEGCEYGIEWVVRHIIETELDAADTKEAFEQSISECYPETTKIGWIEIDTVTALKELDPVSWQMAESEWIDSQVQDGDLVTFDNGVSYYHAFDIEGFLDKAAELVA